MREIDQAEFKEWYRWTWPVLAALVTGFWVTFAYLSVLS